jgi:hypothetical protein
MERDMQELFHQTQLKFFNNWPSGQVRWCQIFKDILGIFVFKWRNNELSL